MALSAKSRRSAKTADGNVSGHAALSDCFGTSPAYQCCDKLRYRQRVELYVGFIKNGGVNAICASYWPRWLRECG